MRRILLLTAVLLVALPVISQVTVAPPRSERSTISRIRIKTVTGNDDLRRNSVVSAFLITKDGKRIESKGLNCRRDPAGNPACEGFPNGMRKTLEWDLKAQNLSVLPSDIHRFGLHFKTGRIGPFDSADNWNLRSLEVEYVVGDKTLPLMKNTTEVRFKTDEEWESDEIKAGAAPGGMSLGGRLRTAVPTTPPVSRD